MKSRIIIFVILASIGMFVGIGTLFAPPSGSESGNLVQYQPNGIPFTATIIKRYTTDGKVWLQEHITHSVRSDNGVSKRLRRFTGDGKMVANITRLRDPGRNLEIYVEHFTQSTHHSKLPPHANTPPAVNAVDFGVAESSTLLGYEVYKIKTERPSSPYGESVEERWIAPDLDNFPLRTVAADTIDGTIHGWETEVTSIIPAALPKEAFQVPEGYVERMPSEVVSLVKDRLKEPRVPLSQTSAWDDRYLQRVPPEMKSLVRSRPALDVPRLSGATKGEGGLAPTAPGEILSDIGEDSKTGFPENSSGSGLSLRSRLLILVLCLIVGTVVLLGRRNYLRNRHHRNLGLYESLRRLFFGI